MFNNPDVSAAKAIEFMEEHNFVEPTPAGVARLFREKAGPASKGGLDKREIGEYLAKLKPYNNDVRQAYVETLYAQARSPAHASAVCVAEPPLAFVKRLPAAVLDRQLADCVGASARACACVRALRYVSTATSRGRASWCRCASFSTPSGCRVSRC
jgi:hypothetical protein